MYLRFILRCSIPTVIVMAGCGRGPSTPRPEPETVMPPPVQLFYDNSGGIQDSTGLVIQDAQAFSAQWSRATSSRAAAPQAPAVDFNRQMVILVASGRKTPEDQIRVDSLVVTRELQSDGSRPETLRIVVRRIAACRTMRTAAYPLEIVSARKFTGPIRWKWITDSSNCGGAGHP